jgi:hypothetical protein
MPEITINTSTGEVVESLAQHEDTIERGLKTFVEVGQALQAIRDGRLYREQYDRFEDYCKERWGWNDRRASQLIAASGAVGNVSKILGTGPSTESHAAPLTKLPVDEQADAWEEVVIDAEETGEKITAKKVEQVVAKRRGAGGKPNTAPQSLANDRHTVPELVVELVELTSAGTSFWSTAKIRDIVLRLAEIT